jgi:uncharacterized protein involved in exopolysaccharide biosynthesis
MEQVVQSLSSTAHYELAAKHAGNGTLDLLVKECDRLQRECQTLRKTVKSYESAIEKLTKTQKEKSKEQKAKSKIYEQFLTQIKQDHEAQVIDMQAQIEDLRSLASS